METKYNHFLKNITDFIFVEDEPKPVDVIFVPGNGFPQMAELAATLWKQGYGTWILPSGRYSIVTGKFVGVLAHEDEYSGTYATEGDFLQEVLIKNGVSPEAILKEDQATYTYQNAIFSRKLIDEKNIHVKTAIICCKSQHARRCKMYYEVMFPETEILVCPVDVQVSKNTWFLSKEGIEEVLGEVERCGKQFHEILHQMLPSE